MIKPNNLPVWDNRDQILSALKDNNVVIIESPTGSGKTTQIPLILKEAGFNGLIGITQPRRIATLSVCEFINKQLSDENLDPSYCAYKMRFYDTTTENTKIKILTDGMLLQELKADPALSKYSIIMVDEAHERSLNIDFILGLLKQILSYRDDFKLIISSATINTEVFSKFFALKNGKNAPIVSIKGKKYNVDIKYLNLDKEYNEDLIIDKISSLINEITQRFISNNKKINLDTLVFLPGEYEIKKSMMNVMMNCDTSLLQLYPLYGRLNKEEQERVFTPTEEGKIKIVFATNIAETSLTIDGITIVIDSGYAKFNSYNQTNFTSALQTQQISKASAMQRAGRAGRTSDGICFRLYSSKEFKEKDMYTKEEILRTDLSEVVLRMSDLGIFDFENFPFITQPGKNALKSGEKTLLMLSAIDEKRHLTKIGELMVKYPLLPRHSRALVEAVIREPEIIYPTIISISFLSCKTPYIYPVGLEDEARAFRKNQSTEYGDFIDCVNLYLKYISLNTNKKREKFCNNNFLDKQSMDEIVHVTEQLCEITREIGIPVKTEGFSFLNKYYKDCIISMASGLRQFICVKNKKDNSYHSITAKEIYIHPGSAWFKNQPQFILAGEIVYTTRLYARTVSPIMPKWIDSISSSIVQNLYSSSKEYKNKKTEVEIEYLKDSENNLVINGISFNYLKIKKKRKLVVIPYDKINVLNNYIKRKPNNNQLKGTLLFKDRYLLFDEKITSILKISKFLDFSDNGFLKEKIPNFIYYYTDENKINAFISNILKICEYDNKFLGFVELISLSNGYKFQVETSFNKAVSDTAFSYLNLYDETGKKHYNKLYNKLVKYVE